MTNSFNVNTIQSYIDHKRVFYCTTAAGPKSPAFRLSSRVYSVSAFAPPNLLSHLSSFDAFDISRGIFAKGDLTLFFYGFVTLPLPPTTSVPSFFHLTGPSPPPLFSGIGIFSRELLGSFILTSVYSVHLTSFIKASFIRSFIRSYNYTFVHLFIFRALCLRVSSYSFG